MAWSLQLTLFLQVRLTFSVERLKPEGVLRTKAALIFAQS